MDYPHNYNACKDHLRTAFWKRSQTIDAILEIPAPNASESELLDLVMSLPRNYRVSIYLYYYEGYQVKEIAAMYGKTENAISTYLRRGRHGAVHKRNRGPLRNH